MQDLPATVQVHIDTALLKPPVKTLINGVPFDQWVLDQRLLRIEKLLEQLVEAQRGH